MRPCSTPQCINNATCINKLNQTVYDFSCECQYPFYGRRCELKVNLCLNYTCVARQGTCVVNGTQPVCSCFSSFSGQFCEIMSTQLKLVKAVSTGTAVIAILVMSTFVGLIVSLDIARLFGFNPKPIKSASKSKKKNTNIKLKANKIKPPKTVVTTTKITFEPNLPTVVE